MIRALYYISRFVFGTLFIFSAVVKGVDPLGFCYKIADYLDAFGLDSLHDMAYPLAIIIPLIEVLVGISILTGAKLRIGVWVGAAMMAFFTPLTLYIALANPVGDCGCFGDALVIDNWDTFYKNIFLSIALATIAVKRREFSSKRRALYAKIEEVSASRRESSNISKYSALVLVICYGAIALQSSIYLPVIDFRPYKIGVDIIADSSYPEDAVESIYKTDFKYKNLNSGEVKDFAEDKIPWRDTLNWEFHSMSEPKLIQAGYEPPIKDFTILDESDTDLLSDYVAEGVTTYLWVSYDINSVSSSQYDWVNRVLENEDVRVVGVSGSAIEDIEIFREESAIAFPIYRCDELILKSVIRANSGVVLIQDGVVIDKWHNRNFEEIN